MARRCLPAHDARASWVVHCLVGEEAGGRRAALGTLGDYLGGTDEVPPEVEVPEEEGSEPEVEPAAPAP